MAYEANKDLHGLASKYSVRKCLFSRKLLISKYSSNFFMCWFKIKCLYIKKQSSKDEKEPPNVGLEPTTPRLRVSIQFHQIVVIQSVECDLLYANRIEDNRRFLCVSRDAGGFSNCYDFSA